MSNLPPSSIKFSLLATLVLIGAASSAAALWPLALQAARAQSTELVSEAASTSGGEAETDYLLATWLDTKNPTAYVGLARAQINAGRPDDALTTLNRAGEGSEVEQLKVRTLIELGRTSDAADEAVRLTEPGRPEADLVLAAIADAAAGRTADATALVPRVGSPEAAGRVSRAAAGQLSLAAELYAAGLLRSSSTFALKLPVSYERELLLARIRYSHHTSDDLAAADGYLSSAIAINPSAIEARQLLSKVYRDQGKTPAADSQDALISKLQSGRL